MTDDAFGLGPMATIPFDPDKTRDRSGQGIYYQVPDIGGFGSVEAMLRRIEARG